MLNIILNKANVTMKLLDVSVLVLSLVWPNYSKNQKKETELSLLITCMQRPVDA